MIINPRLRDYLAGSLVANSPAWLLSLISPYLIATMGEIFMVLILFFITMAGGVLAGYLVARRVQSEQVKTGLSTGLFSYALYALFLTITGFRGGSLVDIPSITGFVIGGAVGARLCEIRVSDSNPPCPHAPKKGAHNRLKFSTRHSVYGPPELLHLID